MLHSARNVYGFTNYNLADFIKYIKEVCSINEINSLNESQSIIPLYAKIDADIYDLAAAVSRSSYFSFYTAISIHGLTLQLPKHLYMTNERKSLIRISNSLQQESIDAAFPKRPRQTSNVRTILNFQLHLINGHTTVQ